MWIAFNATNYSVIRQLNYGPVARQGVAGSFEIFAYFDGVALNASNLTTISFKRPDGTNVETTYFMDFVEGKIFNSNLATNVNFAEESFAPFVDGGAYSGYSFIPTDPAILSMCGTYQATINVYRPANSSNPEETLIDRKITSGIVSFYVENAVYNDEYNISSSEWDELVNLISSYSKIENIIFSVNQVSDIDTEEFENNQIFYVKSEETFYQLESDQLEKVSLHKMDYFSFEASGGKTLAQLYAALGSDPKIKAVHITGIAEEGNYIVFIYPSTVTTGTYRFEIERYASAVRTAQDRWVGKEVAPTTRIDSILEEDNEYYAPYLVNGNPINYDSATFDELKNVTGGRPHIVYIKGTSSAALTFGGFYLIKINSSGAFLATSLMPNGNGLYRFQGTATNEMLVSDIFNTSSSYYKPLALKSQLDNGLALKEDKSNKVTSLSNASTDTQYPSAKAVYDYVESGKEIINLGSGSSGTFTAEQFNKILNKCLIKHNNGSQDLLYYQIINTDNTFIVYQSTCDTTNGYVAQRQIRILDLTIAGQGYVWAIENTNLVSVNPTLDGTETEIDSIKVGTTNYKLSGANYTAGTGIDISGDTISVDQDVMASKSFVSETYATKASVQTIESLIPEQATSSNQLADKDFVNSSIATQTSNFLGTFNLVTDLGLTTSATHSEIASAIATKLASLSITPTNNDYVFVGYPDAVQSGQYTQFDRYKYDGSTWSYEYTLNNSSFTAEQWAAINSGITSSIVSDIARKSQNETISGVWTFSSGIKLGNNTDIKQDSNKLYLFGSSGIILNTNGNPIQFNRDISFSSDNSKDIGTSAIRAKNIHFAGSLRDGNNADYGYTLPDSTGLTANSELLDSASAQTISGAKTIQSQTDLKFGTTAYIKENNVGNLIIFGKKSITLSNNTGSFLNVAFGIQPTSNGSQDLGANTLQWRDFYVSRYLKDGVRSLTLEKIDDSTFNVINASDIVNNTLTQAQYDLITNGKPTLISGTILTYHSLLIPPLNFSGTSIQRVFALTPSTDLICFILNPNDKTISLGSANSKFLNLRSIWGFNGKELPAYPTNNTNKRMFTIGANGGALAWEDVPSGGSSVTLNGTAEASPSFYAPTTSGATSSYDYQFLVSSGANDAPVWLNIVNYNSLGYLTTLDATAWDNLKANHYVDVASANIETLATFDSKAQFVNVKLLINSVIQDVTLVRNKASSSNTYSGLFFIEESTHLYELSVYYVSGSTPKLVIRCATVY